MNDERKSLKQYCKEAKKRLKSGFWQNYQNNLDKELTRAKENGISTSKVKEYYSVRISENLLNTKDEFEAFYKKVKQLIDSEGEVSNAIGRLTDKEHFERLSYEERQRYTMNLSELYLRAVERYHKEKSLGI